MSDKNTQREQFEAWMKARPGYPFAGAFANLMWEAWQAAPEAPTGHKLAPLGEQEARALNDFIAKKWATWRAAAEMFLSGDEVDELERKLAAAPVTTASASEEAQVAHAGAPSKIKTWQERVEDMIEGEHNHEFYKTHFTSVGWKAMQAEINDLRAAIATSEQKGPQ